MSLECRCPFNGVDRYKGYKLFNKGIFFQYQTKVCPLNVGVLSMEF